MSEIYPFASKKTPEEKAEKQKRVFDILKEEQRKEPLSFNPNDVKEMAEKFGREASPQDILTGRVGSTEDAKKRADSYAVLREEKGMKRVFEILGKDNIDLIQRWKGFHHYMNLEMEVDFAMQEAPAYKIFNFTDDIMKMRSLSDEELEESRRIIDRIREIIFHPKIEEEPKIEEKADPNSILDNLDRRERGERKK